MKLRGGYNLWLAGRPGSAVEILPEPDVLHLPIRSERFTFSAVCVSDGQRVRVGQALAKDPDNHGVPLLAPRGGVVRLSSRKGHITLEEIAHEPEEAYHPDEDAPHAVRAKGSAGMRRYKLLALGAWQFFSDAHTGAVPDPFGMPRAVIVSTLHLESYAARGDVQLRKRLSSFTRGLEHLQSLLEYQPIHLVLPDIRSEFAEKVRRTLRGYAHVKLTQVPLRYPFDNPAILARSLGLMHEPDEAVWALRTEGVLALDRALTLSRPCTVRLVSLGGPAVESPMHLKAMAGYPLEDLLASRLAADTAAEDVRVISGGVLTGRTVPSEQCGLDAECTGLTVLLEQTEREFLAFMRPGWDRRSHSKCFLSVLRGPFSEALTTSVRGEKRPCVACGACEEVCPARIMPHVIHKHLYQNDLEEAAGLRMDLCVECGLCSLVCPSKIELRQQFIEAKEAIALEQEQEREHEREQQELEQEQQQEKEEVKQA